MKIPSSYLRETIAGLINGNVTYDDGQGFNDVVPVVASVGDDESKYQIFIGDYSDAPGRNKDIYEATATQVIEIVGMQSSSVKKHVDAIGEAVTDLLMPTTRSETLNGTDFHIVLIRPSVNHIVENSGDGSIIVRLILRYQLLIHHN